MRFTINYREMLVEAFRKADKNGDGRLSTAEIHGIYLDHGVDVTMEEVCLFSSFYNLINDICDL